MKQKKYSLFDKITGEIMGRLQTTDKNLVIPDNALLLSGIEKNPSKLYNYKVSTKTKKLIKK